MGDVELSLLNLLFCDFNFFGREVLLQFRYHAFNERKLAISIIHVLANFRAEMIEKSG